mgnify:CR=1 FL=1
MHDIKAAQTHAIISIEVAIAPRYANCPDSIADGLNELLRPEVGEGFIADYSLKRTDLPKLVVASSEPEEGELFEDERYLVVFHTSGNEPQSITTNAKDKDDAWAKVVTYCESEMDIDDAINSLHIDHIDLISELAEI